MDKEENHLGIYHDERVGAKDNDTAAKTRIQSLALVTTNS